MFIRTRAAIALLTTLLATQTLAGANITIEKTFNSAENRWELSVTNNSPIFSVYGFAIAEDLAVSADGDTDTSGWWDAGVMERSNWDLGVMALSGFANQYITLPDFDTTFGPGHTRAVVFWLSGEENPNAPFPLIEVPWWDALESDDPDGASAIAPGATAEIFSFVAINAGSPFAALLGDGLATWEAEYGETVGVGDGDADGIADDQDNCIDEPNADQLDTDGDDIGNACDRDIAPQPNHCVVNSLDLGALKAAFFATPGAGNWNPDADANGDDAINATDLGAMRAAFFMPPGPSGLPNACD